ncbi:MAG: hypothetical protein R3F11_03880 [Verrucomicrobiales bacterium]
MPGPPCPECKEPDRWMLGSAHAVTPLAEHPDEADAGVGGRM